MPDQPLDSIPLPTTVVQKLRSLGVASTAALRSMVEAAPDDLARFLGGEGFAAVTRALDDRADDVLPGSSFESDPGLLGARLEPAPKLAGEPADVTLRDQLFDELQHLRRNPERHRTRIQELERRLNAMLDGAVTRTAGE